MWCRTTALVASVLVASTGYSQHADRKAFYGDLHVHTRYSMDAYTFGTRASPDDAYRFAKGGAIKHAAGFDMQLSTPLDFYAVTDHGEYLGMLSAMADPDNPLSKLPDAERYTSPRTLDERTFVFRNAGAYMAQHYDPAASRSTWLETIAAAERHNDPGRFTTFIGYEYTSSPGGQNLHRNVIFRDNQVPEMPFTRLDSMNPEALWTWMDAQRAKGVELLSIPHNSNGSNGQMFALATFDGKPLDAAYAEQRMRNEPLVEITQVKGTSDTHPFLSPNDEWADFEILPYRIAQWVKSAPSGSYVRQAYLRGLMFEAREAFNPFRFGVIGSSDTHNAASTPEESNFYSKVALLDGTPQRRGSVPITTVDQVRGFAEAYFRYWSASGIAGVWAEENTRASIYDAFRRKETFATSGPRMSVRLFASYDFPRDPLGRADMIERAYKTGVAMGSELTAKGSGAPKLLVWAGRDPLSAALQRIQVIKGSIEDGVAKEQVFDVACSNGLRVDPATHRCPDNGAQVNLTDCSVTQGVGAAELRALWSDPDFDPKEHAAYYLRALENPTCRWSTWDAVRAGTAPRPDLPTTIQERAWTSPIWVSPLR